MGVAKRTRKFAAVKRVIGKNDDRRKTEAEKKAALEIKKKEKEAVREIPQMPSSMFFEHNTALVPPYQVLVDTNFLSRTVGAKLPLLESAMDCLLGSVNIIITECVMAELEKLGPKYRCIVDRIQKHRIYIVATNDRDLKRRIRKVPGVPIMSCSKGKYAIERLPGAPGT
ncbi:PIN domain-like protein [Cladorrhinum samala]|uniref:PIN domain-like protein n=1 Tax=Cladorrhinum samala TaxID=585594 RepID=A0AAV9HZ50_9PEZI|nr:PIN domain-like protein [Cladorrhinum samala]